MAPEHIARIAVLQLIEFPGRSGADSRYALVQIEVVWRYLALIAAPRGQSILPACRMAGPATSMAASIWRRVRSN